MKKQIYIICLTIFCGLLIVGCSSDNLGEQDNKNETEQAQFNKDIREFYEPIVLVENEDFPLWGGGKTQSVTSSTCLV